MQGRGPPRLPAAHEIGQSRRVRLEHAPATTRRRVSVLQRRALARRRQQPAAGIEHEPVAVRRQRHAEGHPQPGGTVHGGASQRGIAERRGRMAVAVRFVEPVELEDVAASSAGERCEIARVQPRGQRGEPERLRRELPPQDAQPVGEPMQPGGGTIEVDLNLREAHPGGFGLAAAFADNPTQSRERLSRCIHLAGELVHPHGQADRHPTV